MRDDGYYYEVGYKKPPVQYQFKKGEPSKNPKGRTKGTRNFAVLFKEALNKKILITEKGKKRRVTAQEAIVLRTVADAMNGGSKAVDRVLKIHPPKSEEEIKIYDEKLVERLFDLDALNAEELDALVNIVNKMTRKSAKVPIAFH